MIRIGRVTMKSPYSGYFHRIYPVVSENGQTWHAIFELELFSGYANTATYKRVA